MMGNYISENDQTTPGIIAYNNNNISLNDFEFPFIWIRFTDSFFVCLFEHVLLFYSRKKRCMFVGVAPGAGVNSSLRVSGC